MMVAEIGGLGSFHSAYWPVVKLQNYMLGTWWSNEISAKKLSQSVFRMLTNEVKSNYSCHSVSLINDDIDKKYENSLDECCLQQM